jgi:hypothetical protein
MRSDAGIVRQSDAADRQVIAGIAQPLEQRAIQRAADAFAGTPGRQVHRGFHRKTVGMAHPPFGRVGVADEDAIDVGRQPGQPGCLHIGDPLRHLRHWYRSFLETDRRGQHEMVVDRRDRFGVIGWL